MAEYTVFKEGMVFPLPDDLPLEYGALLEPLAIAVHTIDIAKVKIGDSVIITGGGSIGLLALQLAVRSERPKSWSPSRLPKNEKSLNCSVPMSSSTR